MTSHIQLDKSKTEDFCRRWNITELALFGSVLRPDFRPDSDVDILVSFSQTSRHSLFDLARMEAELREMLGREVDLVEREAIEQSDNYIRRKHILSNLEQVYVAR